MTIARYTNRPLDVVGAIYGVVGGSNPIRMLDLGVLPLVHDVSREAELGAELPGGVDRGFFTFVKSQDHVATGTLRSTQVVDTLVSAILGSNGVATHRVWVMAAQHWADVQAGNAPTISYIGLQVNTLAGTYNASEFMISTGLTWGSSTILLAGGTLRPPTVLTEHAQLPMYCPPGSVLSYASTCTIAAGTQQIQQHTMVWIGPVGTRPPGIA